MRLAPVLFFALALIGCAPKTEPESTTASQEGSNAHSGGVAPMTSGVAGGMTPVSGTENLGGGSGGGIGQAAKGMAQRAAGAPTAPAIPTDE